MASEASAVAVKDRGRASSSSPSGRLLLRMPPDLHAELASAAERAGTSLNGYITVELARSVGWNMPSGAPAAEERRRRRLLTALLVANAVAVGLAALAAVGLLLIAWLG